MTLTMNVTEVRNVEGGTYIGGFSDGLSTYNRVVLSAQQVVELLGDGVDVNDILYKGVSIRLHDGPTKAPNDYTGLVKSVAIVENAGYSNDDLYLPSNGMERV